MRRNTTIAALLALAVLIGGCAGQEDLPAASQAPSSQAEALQPPRQPDSPQESGGAEAESESSYAALHPYVQSLVDGVLEEIYTPGMSEYERTKAAFDYMIEHTYLEEPIGLSLWRVHGGGEEPIPYLEQRALSPLRFGVGMCEDYAAALTLLLRGMGLQAEYVPGLTYSVEGHLVDHAWTAVRIDGTWYHLDCQLEDNITRHGRIRYRYFLKGDDTMSASHLWGRRLAESGLLDGQQQEAVLSQYLLPDCPQDYPQPEPGSFEETAAPDLEALRAEADAEIAAWEAENGPLPPMELNTVPPVFGLEGFGPADEG